MKKCCALLVLGFLLAACGTVPAPRQIQNSFPINKPFDPVWQTVIEVFAALNLPILNLEKASGLITTDWISFRGQKDETGYCACGTARFLYSEVDRQGKFNVYVKRIDENSCELKVTAIFEKVSQDGDVVKKTTCVSTGKLEAEIFKRVSEKVK